MDKQELRDALAAVRSEIKRLEFRDPAARDRLEKLIASIEPQAGSGAGRDPVAPLLSGLSGAVAQFEVEHPGLTAGLGQVISILSSMGI